MKTVYLGWHRKLVDAVADALLEEGRVWDDVIVFVPTRESANSLVRTLAERGGAVVPPEIMTTEMLLNSLHEDLPLEESMALWAWTQAICTDASLEDLVKVVPATRTAAWALPLAEMCLRAKKSLGECRLGFSDVVDHPGLPPSERDRWETLARLDAEASLMLGRLGVKDPVGVELEWVEQPVLPYRASRVILACVPDPLPLVMHGLSRLEEIGLVSCECWVHAPEHIKVDAWGRPRPEQWSADNPDRPVIDLGRAEEALSVCSGSRGMPDAVVRYFANLGAGGGDCVVGAVDDEFIPSVQAGLETAGWPVYRAMGYEAARTELARLLEQVKLCVGEPSSWALMDDLCRSAVLATALSIQEPHRFACKLDRMMEDHLPDTVDFMKRVLGRAGGSHNPGDLFDEDAQALHAVSNWLAGWKKSQAGNMTVELIRLLRGAGWTGVFQDSLLDAVEAAGRRVARLEETFPGMEVSEALDLLCREISRLRVYTNRRDAEIKMVHWLDLSYDAADYVVLAGMHEGCVPDAEFEDALLPEGLKRSLHLRSRTDRHARDAFLLAGLAASRKERGGLKILVGREAPSGNPCLPSSLLMLCRGQDLPERVNMLFDGEDAPPRAVPFSREGWEWKVDEPEMDWPTVSPSDMKGFLECPLRFWLKRAAGFKRPDFSASSVKAGNAVHYCAERLGPGGVLYGVSEHARLVKGLFEVLENYCERQYGTELTLPVLVQMDFVRQRLERLAGIHLDALDRGWEVVAVEEKAEWCPWPDIPVAARMRIDRIEKNRDTGMLRVVDFKTSKKAVPPKEAHLAKFKKGTLPLLEKFLPEFEPVPMASGRGKETLCRWTELQIPLYVMAAGKLFAGKYNASGVSGSYLNLPLTAADTGYSEWDDLDDAVLKSADSWARNIVKRLRGGRLADFPSAEQLGWDLYPNDPFTLLFPEGLHEAFSKRREER